MRGNLSTLQRGTVGALITIDVHARDVVERLIAEEVTRYKTCYLHQPKAFQVMQILGGLESCDIIGAQLTMEKMRA